MYAAYAHRLTKELAGIKLYAHRARQLDASLSPNCINFSILKTLASQVSALTPRAVYSGPQLSTDVFSIVALHSGNNIESPSSFSLIAGRPLNPLNTSLFVSSLVLRFYTPARVNMNTRHAMCSSNKAKNARGQCDAYNGRQKERCGRSCKSTRHHAFRCS